MTSPSEIDYVTAMLATWTGWLVGLLLGMRHALEPDHLAAVSTLVSNPRDARRGALLGLSWGVGHTLALLLVGTILAVLRADMPPRLTDAFELCVAAMLCTLGTRAVWRAARTGSAGPVTHHHHRGTAHEHAGPPDHVHLGTLTLARQPLLVGLVHGLAGSGALTALVLANLSSTGARLAYIALFGVGSVLGMAALSGLAGWPLSRLGHGARRVVGGMAGVLSAALGLVWAWPLVNRLL